MKVSGFQGVELQLLRRALEPVDRFLSCVDSISREKVTPVEAQEQGAPGNAKWEPSTRSIVLYDKGVYHDGKLDPVQFRRSIYHELAHAILLAEPALLTHWTAATSGDGYVDEYAKTSPEEDFADSFSEQLLFPAEVRKRAPRKSAFLKRLFETEKTAMKNNVLIGFSSELTKIAFKFPAGLGKGIGKMLPKIGLGLGGAGAVGLAGEQIGEHKGEKEGFDEGITEMQGGMRQAYTAGVQRGALAMRDAILHQMSTSGSPKAD